MPAIRVNAFRGQHGSADLQSRLASYSFVDTPAVAAFYALHPNDRTHQDVVTCPVLMHCELVIDNSLTGEVHDPFIEFVDLEKKVGTAVATRLMLRHADHAMSTSAWDELFSEHYSSLQALVEEQPEQLKELYLQVWPLLDDPDSVADLQQAGIDGAAYRGSGVSMNAVEYRVFDLSQVKVVQTFQNLPRVISEESAMKGEDLNLPIQNTPSAAPKPRTPRFA